MFGKNDDFGYWIIFAEGKGKSVRSYQSNKVATRFSFQELSKVTGGFNELIGEGGFGRVYKGRLQTGEVTFRTLFVTILL